METDTAYSYFVYFIYVPILFYIFYSFHFLELRKWPLWYKHTQKLKIPMDYLRTFYNFICFTLLLLFQKCYSILRTLNWNFCYFSIHIYLLELNINIKFIFYVQASHLSLGIYKGKLRKNVHHLLIKIKTPSYINCIISFRLNFSWVNVISVN